MKKKITIPKYSYGQMVDTKKPDFYGNTYGEIVEIRKVYKETYGMSDDINPNGLVTFENTIKDCQLPYTFENDVLIVNYPERDYGTWIQKAYSQKSIFFGYAYVVKAGEGNKMMRTVYIEKNLKPRIGSDAGLERNTAPFDIYGYLSLYKKETFDRVMDLDGIEQMPLCELLPYIEDATDRFTEGEVAGILNLNIGQTITIRDNKITRKS